jgi:NIPSNAP
MKTAKAFSRRKLNPWIFCAAILVSFAAGSLTTARLVHLGETKAANANRVFELMIYHIVPGKASALESLFRDSYKLQAKHGLNVIGYWVPNEDPAWKDTFVYLIAHPSRAEADAHWHSLHVDPAFLPYRKAAEPLIERVNDDFKVDEVYMRPTDFSAMK